jgi:hypothetical protein
LGVLYDLASSAIQQLETKHSNDPMALIRAKGDLATRTGFLVSLVSRNDPDDPVKITKLMHAASELGITL